MVKYYTPKLEDLHIGTEYQYLTTEGEWKDAILDIHRFKTLLGMETFNVRIAHLKVQNFKALGFEGSALGEGPNYEPTEEEALYYLGTDEKEVEIRYWWEDNTLVVSKRHSILFDGYCRCINELKTILKCINTI